MNGGLQRDGRRTISQGHSFHKQTLNVPGHFCFCRPGQPKVKNLELAIFIYSNVGRFQIPRENSLVDERTGIYILAIPPPPLGGKLLSKLKNREGFEGLEKRKGKEEKRR